MLFDFQKVFFNSLKLFATIRGLRSIQCFWRTFFNKGIVNRIHQIAVIKNAILLALPTESGRISCWLKMITEIERMNGMTLPM